MAPKYELFTQNLSVTDKTTEYLDKKMSKLEKFFHEINDIRVDLSHARTARQQVDRFTAQITLRGRGFILRSEESADDLISAIDNATEKIQRQIDRFKGKRERQRGIGAAPVETPDDTLTQDEEEYQIIRRKSFALVPMSELEAIEQMNLLGHENFFVFYNANTSAVNVIYKRNDGSYGLIETSVA